MYGAFRPQQDLHSAQVTQAGCPADSTPEHARMRILFLLPIRFYRRFITPLKGPTCRFAPTCSEYAQEAIQVHGVFKGSYFALRRILRCHPFGGSGYDPVPAAKAGAGSSAITLGKNDTSGPINPGTKSAAK